jgi:hypothetical protein
VADLESGGSLGARVHAVVVVVVPEEGSQEDVDLGTGLGGAVSIKEGAHQLAFSAHR